MQITFISFSADEKAHVRELIVAIFNDYSRHKLRGLFYRAESIAKSSANLQEIITLPWTVQPEGQVAINGALECLRVLACEDLRWNILDPRYIDLILSLIAREAVDAPSRRHVHILPNRCVYVLCIRLPFTAMRRFKSRLWSMKKVEV